MSWTHLFKVKSFDAALKSKRKNFFHVDPFLKGRGLAEVVKVFKHADIPFVWKEKEVLRENNPESPNHRMPKRIFREQQRIFDRVLKIRQGLVSAKAKELKYKQEQLDKRKPKGILDMIKKTMPYMMKPTNVKIDEGYTESKGKGKKVSSQFVKDAPKPTSRIYGRKQQEKIKNLMDDEIITNDMIQEMRKARQSEKMKQAEEGKKGVEPGHATKKMKHAGPLGTKAMNSDDKDTKAFPGSDNQV